MTPWSRSWTSRTLRFHHDKHFAAYVDNLNQLLERRACLSVLVPSESCVSALGGAAGGASARASGTTPAGVYNHGLYFRMLPPPPALRPRRRRWRGPSTGTSAALARLKAAMKAAALGQFGSGWAWLVSGPGRAVWPSERPPTRTRPLPPVPPAVPATCGSTPTTCSTRTGGETTSRLGGSWWTGRRSPGSTPIVLPAGRPGRSPDRTPQAAFAACGKLVNFLFKESSDFTEN